ncbi:probable cytosolic oligopeptidase A [Aegilops tauschii subsp. strangulata]|uniref:probable cytosolic oligopeptidase A n=1 Tax=Aegilops tauschii subsp. strangulata TaxID=200361 RepID=UPI001E1C9FE1|nr:probable cytosolic oligopeptidase A [Aegilops tauschii subsp. strangulata]
MAGRKETALNLAKFVDKGVQVKLTSGRQVTGTLKGYDLLLNLVLDQAVESEREGELEELEKGVEPAWERLVHPLERIVDRLNAVDHIKVVKDSPDLCAAVEDVQVVSLLSRRL